MIGSSSPRSRIESSSAHIVSSSQTDRPIKPIILWRRLDRVDVEVIDAVTIAVCGGLDVPARVNNSLLTIHKVREERRRLTGAFRVQRFI